MKKMNKTYEAPVAEVIEVVNAGVLMASAPGGGNIGPGTGGSGGGNLGGGGIG